MNRRDSAPVMIKGTPPEDDLNVDLEMMAAFQEVFGGSKEIDKESNSRRRTLDPIVEYFDTTPRNFADEESESEDAPWIPNPPDPTISKFGIDESSSVLTPLAQHSPFHSPPRKTSFPHVTPLFKSPENTIEEAAAPNLEVFSQEDQMKDLEDISDARRGLMGAAKQHRASDPLTDSVEDFRSSTFTDNIV